MRAATTRLLTPAPVGDVKLVAPGAAAPTELAVDGVAQGRGHELTLAAGSHTFELRDAAGKTWRGRGDVAVGQLRSVVLEAQTSPSAQASVSTSPSAWPWVFGAAGVAGLAGYGILQLGPKHSAKSDLADGCAGHDCPTRQRDARDRASRFGTFSAVSLGVGVVGLAVGGALLLWPSKKSATSSRLTGSVEPSSGGASVHVGGSF